MADVLVTSYSNPDLDGVACAVAYAELLRKQGRDAVAGIFGEPDEEAKFVLEKNGIEPCDASRLVDEAGSIVLVDASNLDWMDSSIDSSRVVEVIDHREHSLDDSFDADTQVELVGAAATLIAERFKQSKYQVSEDSAELLYAAVADNTLRFRADVTTGRDVEIADWLGGEVQDPGELVSEVFRIKSEFDDIGELVRSDYYHTDLAGYRVGISQVETIDALSVLERPGLLEDEMRSLEQEDVLDIGFITVADIEDKKNYFLAVGESRGILEEVLDVTFEDHIAEREGLLLRKQLIPEIRKYLSDRKP